MCAEERPVYPVYIDLEVLLDVTKHALEELPREVIGFLLGRAYTWNGETYVHVTGSIRGRSIASETSVAFAPDSLAEVAESLRRDHPDKEIVGWYHSHPGYGCFLSPTDITSHKSCFAMPHHVALVVDPVRKEAAFFRVSEGFGYEGVRSAIVRRRV
ncbi:MAG: Mov34/MPN/PAD-1 family protein [Nitrososphaerota archaeon]|nr:Mov34/MPN/PAD-1 family protein [Candidatus Calditenuis fumarioli]